MKRILITGANSYIGTSLEKYLNDKFEGEFQIDTLDMHDGQWKTMSFAGYDSIFHVAGIAHQNETQENQSLYYVVNRDLAIETVQKAKNDGVGQVIFLSSMSVYGFLKGQITNTTPLNPNTHYGKSKMQAEEGILPLADESFKVCVLRPPMIYGKACKGNYQALVKFAKKLKIFPYVKNQRSMLYIENLCEFVRLMIINQESGIFFPQNSEYTNTSQMVKAIATAHNRKLCLIHGFGWAVKFMGLFTKLVTKAFGNLTYDMSMSQYKEDYQKYQLQESIERTEQED